MYSLSGWILFTNTTSLLIFVFCFLYIHLLIFQDHVVVIKNQLKSNGNSLQCLNDGWCEEACVLCRLKINYWPVVFTLLTDETIASINVCNYQSCRQHNYWKFHDLILADSIYSKFAIRKYWHGKSMHRKQRRQQQAGAKICCTIASIKAELKNVYHTKSKTSMLSSWKYVFPINVKREVANIA